MVEFLNMSMFAFYGLDWIAMLLLFAHVYLLAKKAPIGFLLGIVVDILWISVGMLSGTYGLVLGNFVLIFFHGYGYYAWMRNLNTD